MSRVEKDFLGSQELEDRDYFGIHTKRGVDNFPVSGERVNLSLIYAMVTVKKAVAMTNVSLGHLSDEIGEAIIKACDLIVKGDYQEEFPTDAYQGGAGTTTHMNVNEVVANVALTLLGRKKGDYHFIHPLDHVNMGQSTNDVYPTALRIAAIEKVRQLSEELARLQEAFQQKENEFADVTKLGRTQLMDALPVSLGEEFGCFAQGIGRDRWRIYKVEERLRQVNLGGTAVGTFDHADRQYVYKVIDVLRDLTGFGLARAEYPMDLTQNCDVFVEVSGLLKACAVNLMKISGDLRLMNSGPKGGLGEISLPARQAGSTIMPTKVNPVIPEMVTQVAFRVMANDSGISFAAASGQLELNAFMPFIAHSLLESLTLLENAVKVFREKCIQNILANSDNCAKYVDASNVAGLTERATLVGYDAASEEAHKI